jgi:hypothetical protein
MCASVPGELVDTFKEVETGKLNKPLGWLRRLLPVLCMPP